ncbi:MAG: hypothetical protein AB7F98_13690 [Novosphingobium sp.]
MNLSPLESHVLAYFLTHGARDFSMVGRWWPRSEVSTVIIDKVGIAVRPFGNAAAEAAKTAGEAFAVHLLANGAFSTKEQKFGGTMHQFQPDAYRATLDRLVAADPVLKEAAAGGDAFWADSFGKIA